MISIKARSRLLNLQGSYKLLYVVIVGMFVTLLSFLLYRNLLVSVTLVACTVVAYVLLGRAPRDIEVVISDDGLVIDTETIPVMKILGWSVVDVGDFLEFVVYTSAATQQFYYFYVKDGTDDAKSAIQALSQLANYDMSVAQKNIIHLTLRRFGLK